MKFDFCIFLCLCTFCIFCICCMNNTRQLRLNAHGKQREALGSNGKQREATRSNAEQREATRSNGKQREATGSDGKQREATGSDCVHTEGKGTPARQAGEGLITKNRPATEATSSRRHTQLLSHAMHKRTERFPGWTHTPTPDFHVLFHSISISS